MYCKETPEYLAIPGQTWMEKLKFAFDEVDTTHQEMISCEQWIQSRIRYLFAAGFATEEGANTLFSQIDANSDNFVSWDELVDYLMSQQKASSCAIQDKDLHLTYFAPDAQTAHKFRRAPPCLRAFYLPIQGNIVSLNENKLIFWDIDNCTHARTFSDNQTFIDMCYMQCMSRIVLAKSNRTLIFYDLKTQSKMDLTLSASIECSEIPSMSYKECKRTMQRCKLKNTVLFHQTTALGCQPDLPIIYVGDEEGRLEIFHFVPSTKTQFSWDCIRLKTVHLHDDSVTQISYISEIGMIASSSDDSTIKIWQFDLSTKVFSVSCVYNQYNHLPIRSFVFDGRTNDLVYTTSSHIIGSWRVFSRVQNTVETPNQMVKTMIIAPISADSSFLVTVSEHNFINIYSMPTLEQTSSTFMSLHHRLTVPSGMVIIGQRLYMIGSYMSCWYFESGDCDRARPHHSPIVATFSLESLDRIMTIDESGTIFTWDAKTGTKLYVFKVPEEGAIVSCAQPDLQQRRIALGYTNGTVKIIASNSGALLCEIPKEHNPSGCQQVLFMSNVKSRTVVTVTGWKTIVIFDEKTGNTLKLNRTLSVHKEHILTAIILKGQFVLSLGMGHEVFMWSTKGQLPVMRFLIDNEPFCASDLLDKNTFVIGDSKGQILLMSISQRTPLQVYDLFHMTIDSKIIAVSYVPNNNVLVAANNHGYLKVVKIDDYSSLHEIRACDEGIECMCTSDKCNIVATSGRDQFVRIWSLDSLALIGQFGQHQRWKLDDKQTWMNETSFETDPSHFEQLQCEPPSDEQPPVIVEKKDEPTIDDMLLEDIEIYQPITRPTFALSTFDKLMSEIDEVCRSGTEIRAKAQKAVNVVSPGLIPPPSPEFEWLVPNQDLERTSSSLKCLRKGMDPRRMKKKDLK